MEQQLLSVQKLVEIESRLDFLGLLVESSADVNMYQVEKEIDSLINLLTNARKKARINEIGLKLISH